MRLSFKRDEKATGLSSIASPFRGSSIKRNGNAVGRIRPPHWRTARIYWTVALRIKKTPTTQDPCEWGWIIHPGEHASDEKAREWVKSNWHLINHKYDLAEEKP